jgi:nitrite reductase (NO-forming)
VRGRAAAGLVLFAVGLRGMQRRSLQRARWAVRWYYACTGFLGTGVLAGLGLAVGVTWPVGSLLGAHLALNLAGWFGTAIVGTLHTLHPSLTHTQLRFARLQGPTFAAWTGGAAALAAGLGSAIASFVLIGWLALGLAAGLLVANLAASVRAAPRPLSLPARLITLAQAFLLAGVTLGAVGALGDDGLAEPRRGALAVLLLAGWLGLTVLASMLHLLAVLARVRDHSRALPPPRPARDRALVALAAVAVSALAASRLASADSLLAPSAAALTILYAVLGGNVLLLAARALLHSQPKAPSP